MTPNIKVKKDELTSLLVDMAMQPGIDAHYERRRYLLQPFIHIRQKLSNKEAEYCFSKKQTAYYNVPKIAIFMCLFFGLVVLFAVLWNVFTGWGGDLAALVIAYLVDAVALSSFVFLVIDTYKKRRREIANFIKLDEIYTIYDSYNVPTIIEMRGNRIRILREKDLFVITPKKIHKLCSEKSLRRAYLTMFPISIFNLYNYIDEYPISEEQIKTVRELEANTVETEDGYNTEISLQGRYYCNFYGIYKYMLCFDKNAEIIKYYFAVTESLQYDFHFITEAQLNKSGKIDQIFIPAIYSGNQKVKNFLNKYLSKDIKIIF